MIITLLSQVLLLVPNILQLCSSLLLHVQTVCHQGESFSTKKILKYEIFSQDDEPTVALVMGGRHPGHYFMDSDDFNDIVSRNKVGLPTLTDDVDECLCLKVCPVAVKEDNVEVSRAGGVSSYHSVSGVVLCGGRNGANQVLADCIQYNLTSHMVSDGQ